MNKEQKFQRMAVIKIGGSQYIVKEGDTIKAELPKGASGAVEIREVLLVADADNVKIGKPYVKGAAVTIVVSEQKRGRKLRVLKYKAKTRYRKIIGFRPVVTTLKVEKISA
jgi:large subunit ribosomal protein L21